MKKKEKGKGTLGTLARLAKREEFFEKRRLQVQIRAYQQARESKGIVGKTPPSRKRLAPEKIMTLPQVHTFGLGGEYLIWQRKWKDWAQSSSLSSSSCSSQPSRG